MKNRLKKHYDLISIPNIKHVFNRQGAMCNLPFKYYLAPHKYNIAFK